MVLIAGHRLAMMGENTDPQRKCQLQWLLHPHIHMLKLSFCSVDAPIKNRRNFGLRVIAAGMH
jgi:hypothetical protein